MPTPSLLDPLPDAAPPPRTGVQIMGDPLPWPRAGASVKPGKDCPKHIRDYVWKPWIHWYPGAEAEHYQEKIAILWQSASLPFFETGPLVFRAEFMFARPSGHLNAQGNVLPRHLDTRPGGRGNRNTLGERTGGDTDNLVKIILDALNKVAYKDDGQVARVEAEKCYVDQAGADRPQTIFDLLPLTHRRSAFS